MKYLSFILAAFFIGFFMCSCSELVDDKQYNVLWITCEDISPTIACYGDSSAFTPVLDKLAGESMVYDLAFATVGVCAPSRSSIITGMYPVAIGTHNMRTGRDYAGWGERIYNQAKTAVDINGDSIPKYSAVVPAPVKCFTEYLRKEGYYCTNNQKCDYQFAAPVTAWDANSKEAHWKNREKGQHFFSVFNFEVTHESRMWMNKKLEMTVDPQTVPVPDYFPDNPIVRNDIARNYSNIELLDKQVGDLLNELEEDGLLDETIVFFYSDHGGPLPRGKREHYDSGLKVPFMIRFPGAAKTGRVQEMISFVDLAPTMLSLIGVKPPEYMQGQAFLGKFKAENPRRYIYGTGDRFDEFSDRCRTVRDEKYMYVRNYFPNRSSYKDVAYRKQMDMMNELLRLNNGGMLNEKQAYYFRESKAPEEFYDCLADPYQLNNLIDDRAFADKINEMQEVMNHWQNEIGDKGDVPELTLIQQMWPGGIQPETGKPEVKIENNYITLSCKTENASIGYIISDKDFVPGLNSGWKLYHKAIPLEKGKKMYVMSNRIGFKDSEIIKVKL